MKAKPKRRPSESGRDARFTLPLPPVVAIPAILEAGLHPEDDASPEMKDAARQETEYPTDETDEG
jgi:hypothetical protein